MVDIDCAFADGGMDMFAPPTGDHFELDLKFLDNVADAEGPTSSSSGSDGSTGRASGSEVTPPATLLLGSSSASASRATPGWLQLTPQTTSIQTTTPVSSTPLYSGQVQQSQQQYWQSSAVATWHPAFPADVATPAQTSNRDNQSKITVSHSTIEKQRRDRINSLIDELRDLVPPSASVKGPDGGDIKRPKHVVLSDTLALLRHLKEKVQQDELERQRLHFLKQQMTAAGSTACTAQHSSIPAFAAVDPSSFLNTSMVPTLNMPMGMSAPTAAATTECTTLAGAVSQSAQYLMQHSLSGSLPSQTAAEATAAVFGPSSCPELPQAPTNLPTSVGVLVEEGPGTSFLVKVNCRDRHGLLSDITQALCGLPLQISRAAITTSHGGAVYDVFEIVAEASAGSEPVTALDVQFYVHQALHKWKSANTDPTDAVGGLAIGKRQRI